MAADQGNGSRIDEAGALAAIRGTYTDLQDWSHRLKRDDTWTPPAGSELAADDEAWLPRWMSQLILSALNSGVEHLRSVADMIETGRLRVFPPDTALRAAMLAGAQALWLIAPDDAAERRRRALILSMELTKQEIKWLRDFATYDQDQRDATNSVLAEFEKNEAKLSSFRANANDREAWDATKVIEQAAARAFPGQPVAEARLVWRGLSGAAHGYAWSAAYRATTVRVTSPTDSRRISLNPSPSVYELSSSFSLAYGFIAVAWIIWDRRYKPNSSASPGRNKP